MVDQKRKRDDEKTVKTLPIRSFVAIPNFVDVVVSAEMPVGKTKACS